MSCAEPNLTCPISLELFEDPVQTPCCGNTLSRAPLKLALPRCPLCRVDINKQHSQFCVDDVPVNRTVANLVDSHRKHVVAASTPYYQTPAACKAADNAVAVATASISNGTSVGSGECGHCTKSDARLRCSRCRSVYYCSAVCQRAAWPEHKSVCKKAERKPEGGDAPAVNLSTSKMEQRAISQRVRTERQRAAVCGGLASARDGAFAPLNPNTVNVSEARIALLLPAIIDSLKHERLHAFSDPPNYDRLLLASRRAAGSDHGAYEEHILEAGYDVPRAAVEASAPGSGDGTERPACCRWTMMDYRYTDLRTQGLVPVDATTLRQRFSGVLATFDASREHGGTQYVIAADPCMAGAMDDDADQLVEQLIADSSLRFLLQPRTLEQMGRKRMPPDPNDVHRALNSLGGISLARR